jgi:hypothetical protein
MAERRRLTLLQLAVAASIGLVPVLFGVLLIVASARQADSARPAQNGDRHVSVRHVAALKTFEYAIIRRDQVKAGPPSAETLLEHFPQCRTEWDGRGGVLSRARRLLTRPSNDGSSGATRMAAQLDEIDQALLAFSSGDNRRVSDKVGLDSARWFEAVTTALQTPIEAPEYPGIRFAVQCADIAGAVSTLARSNGRMLVALAWRGTEVDRVIARWRPEQFVEISARDVARSNPWAGIPGCIYFGKSAKDADDEGGATYFLGGVRGLDDRLCQRADMRGLATDNGHTSLALRLAGEPAPDMPVGDERWKIPPSLSVMLQPLETLHRPSGSLYLVYTAAAMEPQGSLASYRYGPNRIDVGGTQVEVGFSIDLTIDPSVQALAQQTAACYTGRDDVCRALDIRRKEDGSQAVGHGLLEHAMVRMAAVAIIDVESGRIEALAGALSPCTREEYDGPGRSARCDKRLPYPIRYRPDALLNPAVFHDAMPGSTIKPIMGAAFLSDPAVGARWLSAERAELARAPTALPSTESLRGQLMRSNSARFLDRMFCADKGFAPCERPWEIQAMAPAFGWNSGCAVASEECGKRDLLFGRALDALGDDGFARPPALAVPYGRLLTEPVEGKLGAPFRVRPVTQLDSARVRQCAAGPDGQRLSKDDWVKCRGGVVVDVVAEGWGQGHARASALGSAGMMAMLAAAANGQTQVSKPHLVQALRGAGPADARALRWSLANAEPNRIARDAAEVIISGLSFSHRAGTARLACEQVFDARTCAQMDWIAGKTGTPTFPNDNRSLDDLARLCASVATKARRDRDACGPLRPYKWYVAAYRTDPADPRWNKVIGVLTERNWLADSGRVHGAGDHGPNPAAEIAMQIAGRHAGVLAHDTVVAQGTK